MPYSAKGRTIEQVLADYEAGLLNGHGGATTEYLHAVIMVQRHRNNAAGRGLPPLLPA